MGFPITISTARLSQTDCRDGDPREALWGSKRGVSAGPQATMGWVVASQNLVME